MTWQEEAIQLRTEDKTYPEIAEILGAKYGETFHPEQIRGACRRRDATEKIKKSRVTFEDIRTTSTEDVEHFIEAMIALQDAQSALDTKQVEAAIRLDETKPVGLAFWGDWHLGGSGVKYRLFQRDLETILSTDGLYCLGLGDYKDNMITGTPAGANFEQIIQPGMQDKVVLYYMEQIGEKMLALVRGCHDDWTKKQGDTDFVAACAEKARAVNFWHGGTLTIHLGEQTYTGHIRHKFKYESSLNTTNAHRRMMETYGPADFAALAHLHNPEGDDRHFMGAYRSFVRSGSYKVWDEFGQKIGGFKGRPGIPVAILYPDEHRIVTHRDLRTGIEHLKALRG